MPEPDLVVVGGGIAGCALATAMARQGASVVVLERQQAYSDHVRGEIIWPWGVRVARLLGVEQPLLDAGALVVRWLDEYDEAAPGPERIDVGGVIDGVGGSLNITHPAACAALAETAAQAGADVRAGIRKLEVVPGSPPLRALVGGRHGARGAACAGRGRGRPPFNRSARRPASSTRSTSRRCSSSGCSPRRSRESTKA